MKTILFSIVCLMLSFFSQAQEPISAMNFPKIQSNVIVPLEVPIQEINSIINQTVTGVLYEDNSFTDNNNDQLKVKVEKDGSINIKALTNNRLMISVPLKIWAEKGYGTLGYYVYKDTQFNVIINFVSSVSALPNWKLSTSTISAGFVWKQKPVLDYGKIQLPITTFIEPILKKQQQSFCPVIDKQVADKMDLQPYLLLAWNQFAKPINISEDYKTWLKITPLNLYLKPLQIFSNKIKTTVGIDVYSETFVGQIPNDSKVVSRVPNFTVKNDLASNFNLQTTATISYDEATSIVKSQFLNKEFVVRSEKNKVKIEDVLVYADGSDIVIEAHTSGEVNGISYIKGKPIYNAEKNKIVLTETDFKLKTKNVFQKAISVLFEGKIRKMIENDFGIPLDDLELTAKKSITESFNKEYYKGVFLKGNVLDLKPSDILVSSSFMTAIINTKAELELKVSGLSF